jgi:site-specific recombinase XerD
MKEYKEYADSLSRDKSKHTINTYHIAIQSFIDHFEIKNIDDVKRMNSEMFRKYQGYLQETGLSNSSVNSRFRPISAFMNFLLQNDYILNNPMKGIKYLKEPKKVYTLIDEKERDSMISSCRHIKDKMMICFMFVTGMRREEIINAKKEDIDWDKQTILVHGKGSKERLLPIQSEVFDMLKEYIKTQDDGEYLFTARGRNTKMSLGTISLRIKSCAKKAGISPDKIKKISPHVVRRSFATNLLEQGFNIFIIRDALGHNDVSTTEKYARVTQKAMRNALLSQKIGGS